MDCAWYSWQSWVASVRLVFWMNPLRFVLKLWRAVARFGGVLEMDSRSPQLLRVWNGCPSRVCRWKVWNGPTIIFHATWRRKTIPDLKLVIPLILEEFDFRPLEVLLDKTDRIQMILFFGVFDFGSGIFDFGIRFLVWILKFESWILDLRFFCRSWTWDFGY